AAPVGSLDALRAGPLRGPEAESAAVPAARREEDPGRPVSWTIAGAALLGGAGTALFLRLRWGPVPPG
ncbi:D-alanyl-D-alanine carboxypeptidase, partial [Streptomyces pilosus]